MRSCRRKWRYIGGAVFLYMILSNSGDIYVAVAVDMTQLSSGGMKLGTCGLQTVGCGHSYTEVMVIVLIYTNLKFGYILVDL